MIKSVPRTFLFYFYVHTKGEFKLVISILLSMILTD
jgi:hypothetical protein